MSLFAFLPLPWNRVLCVLSLPPPPSLSPPSMPGPADPVALAAARAALGAAMAAVKAEEGR